MVAEPRLRSGTNAAETQIKPAAQHVMLRHGAISGIDPQAHTTLANRTPQRFLGRRLKITIDRISSERGKQIRDDHKNTGDSRFISSMIYRLSPLTVLALHELFAPERISRLTVAMRVRTLEQDSEGLNSLCAPAIAADHLLGL